MKRILFLLCLTVAFPCTSTAQSDTTPRSDLPKLTLLNHKKVMKQLFGPAKIKVREVGIVVYDGVDAMEAVGMMSVLSELMDTKVRYLAVKPGIVRTDVMDITVEHDLFAARKLDMLVVPGGSAEAMQTLKSDPRVVQKIKELDARTVLSAATGTGNALLDHAGVTVLRHEPDTARFRVNGKYWSAQHGTAAIDMGLAMIRTMRGDTYLQGAMLDLEYAPLPPEALEVPGIHAVDDSLHVGIMLYDGCFTLDVLGPLSVLARAPRTRVELIATDLAPVRSGRTVIHPHRARSAVSTLDVVLAPGGSVGTWKAAQDTAWRAWLLRMDAQSLITSSVCTGAWILGEAGLLRERTATSHWYLHERMLTRYGARPTKERYTRDGKYWTSAGVSAGIDLSLALTQELFGTAAMQHTRKLLAYDPAPPIAAGTSERSDPRVVDMMQQMYDYGMLPLIDGKRK